jgi:hypothetical protein
MKPGNLCDKPNKCSCTGISPFQWPAGKHLDMNSKGWRTDPCA